ncbi:hypothetical protein G3R48_09260 [Shewanella intestini]|uniref:Tetratricopeptide repeat protein n=2 Tax=Shewanella intestini TaxID=2017544 RepID=A0ABS5I2C7_9GAMM|nr:hypothetical protein [Shewanella intestini]MRG36639.1 hypothetical protein [Shewanella sp. XMDDZSB0408]
MQALGNVISHCYKLRKQPQYLEYGAALTQRFINGYQLLNKIGDNVAAKSLPHMHLATLLTDSGQFQQAVSVCQHALEHQLTDGTVTGFEGRIKRIEKAQTKV